MILFTMLMFGMYQYTSNSLYNEAYNRSLEANLIDNDLNNEIISSGEKMRTRYPELSMMGLSGYSIFKKKQLTYSTSKVFPNIKTSGIITTNSGNIKLTWEF